MASISIKNLPDEMLKELKKKAKNNQRSLNGEIIIALRSYIKKMPARDPEEIIRMARAFRAKVKGTFTDEQIRNAIKEGRP